MFVCRNCSKEYRVSFSRPFTCSCGATHYEDGRISLPRKLTEEEKAQRERFLPDHLVGDDVAQLFRGGPGTELAKKLWWVKFARRKKCEKCEMIARHMDQMGCDWCEANADWILRQLKASHASLAPIARSFVPFVESRVRQMIMGAIEAARA